MKEVILTLCVISACTFVSGGKLLAVQSFGAGYPSFHIIKQNDDGTLSCGTYKCRSPPHYCKIESKSDASLLNLVSTVECKDRNMVATDRWTLNQKSPKPGIKITIMTEADVVGKINNKKNNEVDNSSGNMNMQSMNKFFDNMKKSNPFLSMGSGMAMG